MATYRQRGKQKTWDYRVYASDGSVLASGSGFRTKKEAMYEAQKIEQLRSKGSVFSSKQTLYELWCAWYDLVIVPSDLTEATKLKYQFRGKIIQRCLSHKPANKITHSEYQRFINEYGQKVTKNLMTCVNSDIKKMLNIARRDGLLITDFTKGVQVVGLPHKKSPEDKYLHSIGDYKRVLRLLKSKMDYVKTTNSFLLYLMFKTGLRVGEAMAVTWKDIDFDNQTLRTYRRFSGVTKTFCKAKTATSNRTLPLNDDICRMLKKLQVSQVEVLKQRQLKNKAGLVFLDSRGNIPSNVAVNHYLSRTLEELGIDSRMTATGARHTYGSYLLACGVDIWVVAKLLGHKDISQLIKTYGHLLNEVIDREFDDVRHHLLDD